MDQLELRHKLNVVSSSLHQGIIVYQIIATSSIHEGHWHEQPVRKQWESLLIYQIGLSQFLLSVSQTGVYNKGK